MADYRILSGIMTGENFNGSFQTDHEAKSWWTQYAVDRREESTRGQLVLERLEGNGDWIDVPTADIYMPELSR